MSQGVNIGVAESRFNEILAATRKFVEERLFPVEMSIISMEWQDAVPLLNKFREEVKSLGLWCPHIPQQYGGLGLSNKQHGQVSEILGKSPIGHYVFNCQAPDAGNMEILMDFGTEAQKEKYLKPLVEGKITSCFSMTEPENAGSNPLLLSTTAVKSGEFYHINGHKWFTTAADSASFAIVMVVTDPENTNPYLRTSQLIVDTKTEGFQLVRNIPIMGEAGSGYFTHGQIKYEDCKTHVSNLLGAEGAGYLIAQTRLGPGRIHHCMRWIGICERAFDLMCRYAIKRQTSPGKLLAEKQTVQNWIAESRAEINAAKLLVLDAAEKIDHFGQENAKVEISVIKFYVANVLQHVLDRAIQVHGALGITDDTLLSWWYRHERGARIYDGPDEVHKSRVAKEILKKFVKK
ncbi:MAG: acyl-CoA dehydrogenase family protein [Saprospiraceae bacterium]|jgi:acyl-CoA dehydrogenase|nr:acyl-CoA dehydrogenase family protein [Saprospiraceae bacterium]